MSSISYVPYANAVAGTPITLYSVESRPGYIRYVGREATKPANGQITVTLSSSTSKTGVRRIKLTVNTPRISAPVGTNPATGLAFVPTVIDSVTRTHELLVPPTVNAVEVQDTHSEMIALLGVTVISNSMFSGYIPEV